MSETGVVEQRQTEARSSRGTRLEKYAANLSILLLIAYLFVAITYALKVTHEIPYDAHIYDKLATDLAHGKGYHSVFRAPLYPAVLAAIYFVFGRSHAAVSIIQALMNVLTMALLIALSYRIFRTRTVGLVAAGYFALFRPFYEFSTLTLTECLATLLVAIMVYGLVLAMERRTIALFFIVGLATGLVTLAKAVTLLYPFLLVPVIYATRRKGERWLPQSAALVLGTMLVVLPWTARNYRVTHEFLLLTTGGGMNLWFGNWAPYYYTEHVSYRDFPVEFAERLTGRKGLKPGDVHIREGVTLGGKSEPQLDRLFFAEGLKNMRNDPVTTLKLFARKFSIMWFGIGQGRQYTTEGKPIPFKIGKSQFLAMWVMLTGLLSLRFKIPDWRRKVFPIVLLLVYWTAVYVVLVALMKYSFPVMPYLMMLSAFAVCHVLKLDRAGGLGDTPPVRSEGTPPGHE